MYTINFQDRNFNVKEIELAEFGNVLISTNSLNNLLLNDNSTYTSDEAEAVDEKIFYFVEENQIRLSDEELIKVVTLEVR